MEPPQWSLEVALRGAGGGQGQSRRVTGLAGQVQGWVSCPGVTPGTCQHPPQLLPLPHSSVPWALGLWAASPACPLPDSAGIFSWVNIDQVSLSTSFCPFPVQGPTPGRGRGSCVGSGESDGRAGLRRLNSAKTEIFRDKMAAGGAKPQTTDSGSGQQAAVPQTSRSFHCVPQFYVAVLTTQPWPSHAAYSQVPFMWVSLA